MQIYTTLVRTAVAESLSCFTFLYLIVLMLKPTCDLCLLIFIIPSLPPHPNAYPWLIQWLLWLQLRVCCHGGCADVGSMTLPSSLSCPTLTTQLSSLVCICSMSYPDCYQLETIYSTYLTVVCWAEGHPMWSNTGERAHSGHLHGQTILWGESGSRASRCPPSGASISYTTLRCTYPVAELS